MFFKKKLLRRVNKMANIKKENSKTLSEEVIDTLINCFHSYEFIWNVTSGDCKDQNRNSLSLEEFDMSGQQHDINTYDHKKNKIISEANSYKIRTDKITQRRMVVAQIKCFSQLGHDMSN